MNTTVLESILQLLMQDLTVTAAVVVGLTVGLAVFGRVLWGALPADESAGQPLSDGGTADFADSAADADDEELEHRIDELETEVDGLSSTVKTVRNENEQISESVQDIEENTGRLLNLYKMATQGANPFASNPAKSSESAAVTHESSEDEEFSREDEIEEVDTQVADDSATDLFDSPDTEVREEHCVDSVEEVVDSGNEPDDAFQRTKQAEQSEPTDSGTEESVDDQFDAVFEAKAVEPADDDGQFGTEEMIDAGTETGPAASDGGQLLEPTEETAPDSPETTTSTDSVVESEPEPEPEPEPTAKPQESTDEPSAAEPSTPEPEGTPSAIGPATEAPIGTSTGASEGKPYVESLPESVSTEVMTVEWLEYLVNEVGIRGTVRALDYYETVGWLTEEAVEELDEYLAGFEEPDQEELSVEHHLRSLDYVEELQHAGED